MKNIRCLDSKSLKEHLFYAERIPKLINENTSKGYQCIKHIKLKRTLKNDIFFGELLLLWLSSNKIRLKPTTYVKYYDIIVSHLIPELGNKKIKKMDSLFINIFLENKLRNGRLDGKGGLSAGSIRIMIYIIKSAFEFALERNLIKKPLGRIISPAHENPKIDVFTVSEQAVLKKYLINDIDESKLGILIALNTGLRIGEICGLKWEDVNFKESTISVRRTIQRIKNMNSELAEPKTLLVAGEPKTASSKRIVPVPSFLMKYLGYFYEQKKSNFIIPGSTHEFLDPRTYQYRFHEYLKDCNLRDLNFHALRHTFATRCIEVGVDTKTLSEVLGHSNVSITLNIYVHSSLELKRTQLELLNTIS